MVATLQDFEVGTKAEEVGKGKGRKTESKEGAMGFPSSNYNKWISFSILLPNLKKSGLF